MIKFLVAINDDNSIAFFSANPSAFPYSSIKANSGNKNNKIQLKLCSSKEEIIKNYDADQDSSNE
jgi:hypothetical protein